MFWSPSRGPTSRILTAELEAWRLAFARFTLQNRRNVVVRPILSPIMVASLRKGNVVRASISIEWRHGSYAELYKVALASPTYKRLCRQLEFDGVGSRPHEQLTDAMRV